MAVAQVVSDANFSSLSKSYSIYPMKITTHIYGLTSSIIGDLNQNALSKDNIINVNNAILKNNPINPKSIDVIKTTRAVTTNAIVVPKNAWKRIFCRLTGSLPSA